MKHYYWILFDTLQYVILLLILYILSIKSALGLKSRCSHSAYCTLNAFPIPICIIRENKKILFKQVESNPKLLSVHIMRIQVIFTHLHSLKNNNNNKKTNGNTFIVRKGKKNLKSSFSPFLSSILINTNTYIKIRTVLRFFLSPYSPSEVTTLYSMLIYTATT